jgi:hypothetical protein
MEKKWRPVFLGSIRIRPKYVYKDSGPATVSEAVAALRSRLSTAPRGSKVQLDALSLMHDISN